MYKRILHQMRERIRTRQYVMTIHAEEEMSDDGLTIFDVERTILTGKIIERQEDYHTREWKYLISGFAVNSRLAIVVTKLNMTNNMTNKLIIITVYLEN